MSNTPEEEVEVKNQQVLLASLREDIIQASTALSKIYADKKQAGKELAILEEKGEQVKQDCNEAWVVIQRENEYSKSLRKDADAHVERVQKELEVLKTQKKEAMSELRRLNDWVFTAEEDQKRLTVELKDLDTKIVLKDTYIADLGQFKALREDAEAKYKEVLIDTKLAKDEVSAVTEKSDKNLEKNKQELAKIEEKREKAKQDYEEILRNDKRIREELKIYTERIELEHKKVFPNRIMKLRQT